MFCEPNLSATAALMADPTRAMMLCALIDGRTLPAAELALAAGITPQTASTHLARLTDGGLLAVEKEGRHRYYRLAGPHVAQAIEQLSAIHPAGPARRKARSALAERLHLARCCYDHLAGRLGVAVADALGDRGLLVAAGDKRLEVTAAGTEWFAGLGIDTGALRPGTHGIARQCLDCTERRHHVAGPLGTRLLAAFCDVGWLRRPASPRLVEVTPRGEIAFRRRLGVDIARLRQGQT